MGVRRRPRRILATLLSASLVLSGVLLSGPLAHAEEADSADATGVAEAPLESATTGSGASEPQRGADEAASGQRAGSVDVEEAESPADPSADEAAAPAAPPESGAPRQDAGAPGTALARAETAATFGISVSPTTGVEPGASLTVTGAFPERSTAGGVEGDTSVLLLWCADPGDERPAADQCDSTVQQTLSHAPVDDRPATGTVADGVWSFEVSLTPPTSFGSRDCLSESSEARCGVFVRLSDAFQGEGSGQFDQFAPVAFATAPPAEPGSPTTVGSFDWGVRESFRAYVKGPIANGKITVTKPATETGAGYRFPQTKNTWDSASRTGSVSYAGKVNFWGHSGALDLDLANPTVNVKSASSAELRVPYGTRTMTIATIDLRAQGADRKVNADGSIRYTGAVVRLTQEGAETYFQGYVGQDYELDRLAFTIGADSASAKPVEVPPVKKPKSPSKSKAERPVATEGSGSGRAAGSLIWGVSSEFAAYATGSIAKGSVETSGVGRSGGAFVFPQATGGNWNFRTETGTVRYSGVVTFSGHRGLMSESFANPVIAVDSASSGTITAGGRTFTLDLAAASKTTGPGGAVTWSDVPVRGSISGGGSGGGGTVGVDPLTFTVGAESAVSYGRTAVGKAAMLKRIPAPSPPSFTGVTVLTAADKLRAGGRIEIEAAGFEPNDEGVLVVLYSQPVLLDDEASADENGVVRWTGTLPEDAIGTHTITLQGSVNAGAVIEILEPEGERRAAAVSAEPSIAIDSDQLRTAGPTLQLASGPALWEWWTAAGALVLIAACTSLLVVRQRREQS
ncbi:HtaA domain-containing protein [Leucobacter weissii]|uniref:HtaA domain-containing protein n=1 Tax=Leucobacter weissii TaxID=1983706 RepID=A0A939MH66_9MICO|nr:HtaA domain-containing protein [Leucobacter weissii]MBO1900638.1 HtaA domain-containing protein [Leucobacter weissii]